MGDRIPSILNVLEEFRKLNPPNPPRTEVDRLMLTLLTDLLKLAILQPSASRPVFTEITRELMTYVFATQDLGQLEGESYSTVHGLFTAAVTAERLKSHGLVASAPAAGGSRRTRKTARRRRLTRRRR